MYSLRKRKGRKDGGSKNNREMPGLIGRKNRMTSVFSAEEKCSATVIEAGPCVVTQIKTVEKMVMTLCSWVLSIKDKHTTKPEKGHFEKAG